MSLASVGDIKQTTTVVLKHPKPRMSLKNPDGSDMTVDLHGPYSDRYKAFQRHQQQERMKELASGAPEAMTPEEMEAADREMIVACIEGWNIYDTDTEKLEFSEDTARKLLIERPWVFQQLYIALNTTGNFIETPKQD